MVKKKIFKRINKFRNKDSLKSYYQSLSRIIPFSLILIFSFSILPNSTKFLKENLKSNKTIVNLSKQNFEETFNETLKKKESLKTKNY